MDKVLRLVGFVTAATFVCCPLVHAYSVLSHEAIVDSTWQNEIVPAIRARFPDITADGLREAHAYAYGGCIIQDMGYYPFGNKFFSDLLHYVRSGDFVQALLKDSTDPKEYAFALGALAHYNADNYGHPATNRVVPMVYPDKRAKFGDVITYAEFPAGHLQTEFAFDVLQVARGRYASEAYHDFIGFEVAQAVLERAFKETYGLTLGSVLASKELSIGTYRWTVSGLIPEMTKVALATHQKDFQESNVYRYSRKQYVADYGNKYYRPNWFSRLLAWIFRIMPKFGPFRTLAFKPPPPAGEQLFFESFQITVEHYRDGVREARSGHLELRNTNLDDGRLTEPSEYPYADRAYSRLIEKLADMPRADVPPELRADVLRYYHDLSRPFATKKHKSEWKKTLAALAKFKGG
jgi:Zinc dependent phospholipase C